MRAIGGTGHCAGRFLFGLDADWPGHANIPSQDFCSFLKPPDTLTVKFHDGRPDNEFKITKYTYTDDSVHIDWLNADGKESITVFAEFSGNKTTMAQQGSGDKPRRAFHRC